MLQQSMQKAKNTKQKTENTIYKQTKARETINKKNRTNKQQDITQDITYILQKKSRNDKQQKKTIRNNKQLKFQ